MLYRWVGGGMRRRLHTLRLIASGIFDHFPTLHLIIGHVGEMLPMALVSN